MDGIILVDKPVGVSSFGVVARVRRILSEQAGRKIKVGHTGTLDPAASGLMILVVGKHTKRAAEFSKLDKVYEAEVTLGATSTTADAEGDITQISSARPSEAAVRRVLNNFVGELMQTPPTYSAVKVGGQRAYKLARAGKPVMIEPRRVQIFSIDEIRYSYPKLTFRAHVSSGTYIRSLAQDIGTALRTGAYLSALKRTRVGSYDIRDARTLSSIEQLSEISL